MCVINSPMMRMILKMSQCLSNAAMMAAIFVFDHLRLSKVHTAVCVFYGVLLTCLVIFCNDFPIRCDAMPSV